MCSTSEERCVGFPGAGESCAPAPAKLFPGAGERSHSFSIEEKCLGFSRRRGKLCPGAGKAVSRRLGKVTFIQYLKTMLGFPGAGGSCVPAPGKLFPGAGERLAGRLLV